MHQARADQNLDHIFFTLDALIGCSVFYMYRNQLKQLGQETDAEEYLGRSIHTPVQ